MPETFKQIKGTTVAFGDVVQLSKERSNDPERDGFERYLGLEHLKPSDLKVCSWGDIVDGTTFTSVFKPGQVLFGKRRAYQRKVAVADFSGVCSGDIYVLEPKGDELLPELLPFICQSESFYDYVISMSQGGLSPRVNWKALAKYEFLLPPLDEQQRIASAAAASASVTNALTRSILSCEALSSSIKKAKFDPALNSAIPLGQLCSNDGGIQIGPFGAQLHQSDYKAEGIPVVMPLNMKDDRIATDGIARVSEVKANSLRVHRVESTDILLPRRGDLDRRAYVDDQNAGWLCGTGSIRIRVDSNVNSRAVLYALASPQSMRWLYGHAVGTTMPNLNTKIVASVPIALPPEDELDSVVELLCCVGAQIKAMRKRKKDAQAVSKQLLASVLRTD